MSELNVEIVTPQGIVFTGNVSVCTAPGTNGKFQVLAGHAAFLATLEIGEIRLETPGGVECLACAGGFFEVKDNQVSIVVESAELAEKIDVERAKSAKIRAEKRLQGEEGIDELRARLALAKAINRLKISSHN
ncbi:MAG: F0F1 ATP synthase subunit epsilon [Calditrichales bacterium]|nr:MAG: F0F1 ATP synthase subunit epsilon [Calditrichales bacterium]